MLTYARSTRGQTLLLSFNLDVEERSIDRNDLGVLNGARLERLDGYKAPQGVVAAEALVLPPRLDVDCRGPVGGRRFGGLAEVR